MTAIESVTPAFELESISAIGPVRRDRDTVEIFERVWDRVQKDGVSSGVGRASRTVQVDVDPSGRVSIRAHLHMEEIEAHRAKDAGVNVQNLNLMGKLAAASGNLANDLNGAFKALPAFDVENPGLSAKFPPGNLVEARLLDNDLFSAYLTRIDFRRFAAPIPETNDAQAEYWLKFWKGTAPDPAAAKAQFLANCARVDPHVPA